MDVISTIRLDLDWKSDKIAEAHFELEPMTQCVHYWLVIRGAVVGSVISLRGTVVGAGG